MIDKWNEHKNSLGFKIIFGLIAVSFVIGGIGGVVVTNHNSYIAEVNGEKISLDEYQNALAVAQNRMQQQLGDQFWKLLEQPGYEAQFNNQVLQNLIYDAVLNQYLNKLQLNVTDNQIKQSIVQNPLFQQDGKFNNDLYIQTLTQNNITPDNYAQIVKGDLLVRQFNNSLIGSAFLTPVEIDNQLRLFSQERIVRLARFKLQDELKTQTVDLKTAQNYFATHQDNFKTKEKFTVEYLELTPQMVASKVTVTDKQIKDYYQTNLNKYSTKAQQRIAHIEVKSQKEAEDILKKLKQGQDFAQIAKTSSIDILSGKNGGDLGFVEKGILPAEFENTADKLKVGEISNIVKIDKTYHIIKVLARKPQQIIALNKVYNEIKNNLITDNTLITYSKVSREMANLAFENNSSLEPAAKIAGIKITTTKAFDKDHIPEILSSDKVKNALLSSDLKNSGQNSEVFEIGDTDHPKTLIFRIAKFETQKLQQFDQVKDEVIAKLKDQKARQALLNKVTTILDNLQSNKTKNIVFGKSQSFRYQDLNAKDADAKMVQNIFTIATPKGKPSYVTFNEDNGDIVIIALDKVIDHKTESDKLLQQQLELLNTFNNQQIVTKALKDQAKVEIETDLISQNNHGR